ncbi:hypothetical protein QUF64_05340 [Anaerolineales bacterium HSG6]|nr:hypothetical protein [Anaerolineales bacterium HSG6]
MTDAIPLVLSNGYYSPDEHNQYLSFDHVLKAGVSFRFGTHRRVAKTGQNQFYYLTVRPSYRRGKGLKWTAEATDGGQLKEKTIGKSDDITLARLDEIAAKLYDLPEPTAETDAAETVVAADMTEALALVRARLQADIAQLRTDYHHSIELINQQATRDGVTIEAVAEVNQILTELQADFWLKR